MIKGNSLNRREMIKGEMLEQQERPTERVKIRVNKIHFSSHKFMNDAWI